MHGIMNQPPPLRYARIERERRFLLTHLPNGVIATKVRRITDRYIEGANLRLREQIEEGSPAILKLTQKLPDAGAGAQQGLITTMYLSEAEHSLLGQLPAMTLSKTRYSFPPFGIDVFEDQLDGLVLAEAEFDSPGAAEALAIPPFIVSEVSTDTRFTGGSLVRASRQDLRLWLSEYGIQIG
jgi:CYTH domain-containing protein